MYAIHHLCMGVTKAARVIDNGTTKRCWGKLPVRLFLILTLAAPSPPPPPC